MKPSAVDCRKNAVAEKQETRPSETRTDEQARCWIGKAEYERKLCPPGICYVRYVCAVTRRRFPVGASPTRQPLQPEATGAVMEVTKWLKPSV